MDDTTGKLSFDVSVSKEEIAFLVDHAVNNLIAEGVIALSGLKAEEEVQLHEHLN